MLPSEQQNNQAAEIWRTVQLIAYANCKHTSFHHITPASEIAHKVLQNLEEFKALKGKELGVSEWFTVTQERINAFADATADHQWIHIDPERAKRESPFGGPIAHGFLTLSLAPFLASEAMPVIKDRRMGVNYGLNKVRFISPVPAGGRIRLRVTLQDVTDVEGGVQATLGITFELEGGKKPICVAEWLVRYYV